MKKQLVMVVLALLLMSAGRPLSIVQAQSAATAAVCSGVAVTTGASSHTLEAGGLTREYIVYVPDSYDPAQPTPLILSLHGFASSDVQQALWSQWNPLADREGFIVVYPQGKGSPARWNTGQTSLSPVTAQVPADTPISDLLSQFFEAVEVDDVAFFRDLIAQLESDYCIDPARIYVNGLSNGGGMTNRLACEMSDVFAAVGTVAGAYTSFPGGCHPSRPMPVIAFHGVVDPVVPYAGDAAIDFPAIQTWAADWAARDQCDPTPQTVAETVGAVTGVRYSGCADDAEVVLYSIADGGHTWPGGFPIPPLFVGKTTQDIDASATMWAFFMAHPLE